MSMKRLQFVVVFTLVWAGLIWGALQLARLPLGPVHFLCGPWGCIGSTAAVASVHVLWLSVLAPLAVLSIWAVPTLRRPEIWWALLAGALVLLTGLVGRDAWHHLNVERGEWRDLPRRALYCLVTNTDLPVWQVLATALTGLVVIRIWFPAPMPESNGPPQPEQGA